MADSCVLSTDAAGTAILWSLSSRNQIATFKDASSALRSVALVFGSRDDGREHVDGFISCLASRPSVHMFSVAKVNAGEKGATPPPPHTTSPQFASQEQPTFKCGVPEVMHSVAVSADGAYCVCGGASGRAFLWELASGALLRSWSAHYKRIGAAAFSPCGTVVVTGGDDGVVQVWAVAALVDVIDQSDLSAHPVATVTWSHHSLPVTSLRFGPGLGLAVPLVSTSLDRSARVWDVASGRCIFAVTCPAAVHCSAVDPLGRRLYLACADSGASSVCEVDLPAAAARSADPAALLLTGAPGPGASTPAAAAAASTAVGGGADVSGFAGHTGVVNELAVSPDGGLLLTAGQDGVVRLWDSESRSCIQTFEGHRGSPVLSMLLVSRSGRGLGGASDASGATVPLTPMAPLRKHQVPMAAEWKGSTTGPLDAVVVVARPVLDAAGASSASGGDDLGDSVFAGDLSALLSALDALAEEGATAASSHVADAVASSASVVSSELAELRRRNAELENDNRRWKAVNNALKDQLAAAAGGPGAVGMAPASTAAASAAAAGVKRVRNSATGGSSPHQ